jgi:hypothetical protein
MELSYQILNEWGDTYRLIPHFSRFYWLHPYIFWNQDSVPWWTVGPALNFAVKNGHIYKCNTAPWYCVSPKLLFELRGLTLSQKQWAKIKLGPKSHDQMIHRMAYQFRDLQQSCLITIDESVKESSLPGAWGAKSQVVPDILVKSHDQSLPKLWIECERRKKTKRDYHRKLNRIPSDSFVIYIMPNEALRQGIANRFPEPRSRHSRILTFREIEATCWIKSYVRHYKKLASDTQASLFV